MEIGIGHSRERDAFKAGQDVIQNAQGADVDNHANLVLAFCTKDIDHKQFIEGMLSQLSHDTPIVGGTTIGIISNDIVSYIHHSSAALMLRSEQVRTRIARVEIGDGNEERAGLELAERVGSCPDDRFMFLFYNMIKKEKSGRKLPEINSLLSILHGIRSAHRLNAPIFGGGSIGDYQFSSSMPFSADSLSCKNLFGITFYGDFYFDYTIMHGCLPFNGEYHTITKNAGPLILQIDGKPAIELINDIYGGRDWQKELPVKDLTIGVNLGEKYSPYQEGNYVNRLIAGPIRQKKGVLTPEPDWQPGTEIQFMIRDNEEMIRSAKQHSQALLQRTIAAGKKPLLGLYIDCAGRTSFFSNSLQEEAAVVQEIFNAYKTPLFGFYSGFEIAPIFGASRGLEWTGVLILLSKN